MSAVDNATDPPPRVLLVARTERSPGFGPSLAFPVDPYGAPQWHRERRVGLPEAVPVTVAGPHRCCTGFRASPFAFYDCVMRLKSMGAALTPQDHAPIPP
jgi:hypothetical protein